MHSIIFVADIRDPYKKGSSTQIMSYNLLSGLKSLTNDLIFIPILDKGCSKKEVRRYYKHVSDSIHPIYSKLNLDEYSGKKYMQLLIKLRTLVTPSKYKRIAMKIVEMLDETEDIIVISHSPSEESLLICKDIKKCHYRNNNGKYNFIKDRKENEKKLRYIQYWSDPIALSGIYPENLTIKRLPLYLIEKYYLKKADNIVYGTKTLMEIQQNLYKGLASKMNYVDICYSPDNRKELMPIANEEYHLKLKNEESLSYNLNKDVSNTYEKKRILFGYSGNYSHNIRNIIPLYEAFKEYKRADLFICGHGDYELKDCDNIIVNSRYSQSEISQIEDRLDILVCLCNHSCMQIPGKIFYRTNTNKVILVILDGLYADRIRAYLESFQRFEFCYNNTQSIKEAVNRIYNGNYKVDSSSKERLSPSYMAAELCK